MSELKEHSAMWMRSIRIPGLSHGARRTDKARQRAGWLILARTLWWAIAIMALGLFGAGSVARFAQIQSLCSTACDDGRLSSVAKLTLGRLGLSYDAYLSLAHSLRSLHMTFRMYATTTTIWEILSTFVFAAVAAIICWRKSGDRVALFTSLALLLFGVSTSNILTALPVQATLWTLPVNIVNFLSYVGFAGFFLVFPDGRFIPRWTRWIALVWIIVTIPSVIFPGSRLDLNTWPPVASLATQSCVLGVGIWAQIYRYRHVATRMQQVQTKWVVFGAAAAIVTAVGLNLALLPFSPLTKPSVSLTIAYLVVTSITRVAFLIIPITIGIAIVRHRLFDIDLILKWTMVYGALTVVLATLYEGGSTVIERLLLTVTGQETITAAVAVSFAIGLLFHPLRRILQRVIDRWLFRPKYVAERHLETFGERVRSEIDLGVAPDRLEQILDHALSQAWESFEEQRSELHRVRHLEGEAPGTPRR
jgi:hypothetical protein